MKSVFIAEQLGLQHQDKLKEIEERLSLINLKNKKLYNILSKPELSAEDRLLIQQYLKEDLTECINRTIQLDDSNPNKPILNTIGKALLNLFTSLTLITNPGDLANYSTTISNLIQIYNETISDYSTNTEPQQVKVEVEFHIESLNIKINTVQDEINTLLAK